MAQTKRKRRTKHRGNAAGMVESRGRTGRAVAAPGGRADRLNRPPTWRSAINRATIAAAIFVVAVTLIFKQPLSTTIGIGVLMLVMYIPLGYYTDAYIYRRRQQKRQESPRD